MKHYSFSMGELTPGFEWYDPSPKTKSGGEKFKASKLKTAKLLSAALVVSYISGGIIWGSSITDTDSDNGKSDNAVPVMSVISDAEYSVYEGERDARISELADAYIEDYMSRKYGKAGASE